jgi:nicotinate-nucleotide--dimethylbenzimidazole phosphoribosyltransferase
VTACLQGDCCPHGVLRYTAGSDNSSFPPAAKAPKPMTRNPGPLPFNDILDLVDELPAGPAGPAGSGGQTSAGVSTVADPGLPAPSGMLAGLASWMAGWQGREKAMVRRPVLAVFAASHAGAAIAASGEKLASIQSLVDAAQRQQALVCRLCERFGLGLRVFKLAPEMPVEDFTA